MKYLAMIIASVALAATILPALLFLRGSLSLESTKVVMLIATLTWFIVSPLFMWKDKDADAEAS